MSAGMETFLTKATTIIALVCLLVAGGAATVLVGRDSIPTAGFELASASVPAAQVQGPVSNKENKQDRLEVNYAYAPPASEPQPMDAALNESLRRAYASTSPADLGMPREIAAPTAPSTTQQIPPS